MPYSEFTLEQVSEQFQIKIAEQHGIFARTLSPIPVRTLLADLLKEYVPLATMMNTEKARSELIVVNLLMEVRRQLRETVGLFSGVELSVSPANGLEGTCDFLISLSPIQMLICPPIVTVVKTVNADLSGAWGQCLAEMVAAQRFNQARDMPLQRTYGVVTSGTNWMFGVLEGAIATVDYQKYSIDEPERICGILIAMVRQIA